ncbi:MAG TPA: xanthine dehydrogenase family protein molybdopterin-binding subunit [Solirubrobacteraceae bacterium]|nr:xanthine dehydrogenase family protein molybdopterin-binding subunit [Solirubrobacteraceae bacterium]
MAVTQLSWIGSSIERPEDDDLLTGAEPFVADLRLPGQLSAAIVRSPMAHGVLGAIDISEAEAVDGVVAVLTAADVVADLGAVPVIEPRLSYDDSLEPYLQPALAADRVRFVGEPIAVVVARDRATAEDAAELVFPDIEPLEAVLDPLSAPEAAALFDGRPNVCAELGSSYGDAEAALRDAEVVVEAELTVGRHSGIPMECRGIVADYDAESGTLTVHGATKVPHTNRRVLAGMLGVAEESIRMLEMSAGGGFGIKGEFYPEDFLIPWVARRLRRPVSWVEDRREHLLSANHSRDQRHRATIAGTADGDVTAVVTEFWLDGGAYVRTVGTRVGDLTIGSLIGPYDIPSFAATGHYTLTNKTPCGTYRGPGRFESSFVMERLLDLFAARVGLDPVEVRRRNLVRREQMPYTRPLYSAGEPIVLEDADYVALLDRVLDEIDTDELAARRAAGETLGMGVGTFLEKSGLGPWETARVAVSPAGEVTVWSGATSLGQGLRNMLTQVVADTLDLAPEQITAARLDTSEIGSGIGSYASRSTVMAGNAAREAALALLARARDAGVSLAELAARTEGGLSEEHTFSVERVTYGHGAIAAVVRVDPELGAVRVEQLVLGYDVGRAINPRIIEGQLVGAAMQAIGGALLEHFVYDEDGNPLAASFMDYLLPTLGDAPRVTVVIEEVPSTTNPLGVKGVGEAGVPAVAGAVVNAVEDALGTPGTIVRVPLTPEYVCSLRQLTGLVPHG